MFSSNNYKSFFSSNTPSLKEEPTTRANQIFAPKPEQGKNNVYVCAFKFLKNPHNEDLNIVKKWSVWLKNPITGKAMTVDCPTSVGKPSLIQDTFFKLRNSKNVREQELAPLFSRKEYNYSLIQIISDENNPSNVGKIFIFKYGKKIFDKIKDLKEPADSFTESNDPFNLISGKPFIFKAKKQNGYANYDESKFSDKAFTFLAPEVSTGQMKQVDFNFIEDDRELERVFKYLHDNSPDLSQYQYKEWNEEIQDHVNQCISAAFNGNVNSSDIVHGVVSTNQKSSPTSNSSLLIDDITSEFTQSMGSSKSSGKSAEEVIDDIDFESLLS